MSFQMSPAKELQNLLLNMLNIVNELIIIQVVFDTIRETLGTRHKRR